MRLFVSFCIIVCVYCSCCIRAIDDDDSQFNFILTSSTDIKRGQMFERLRPKLWPQGQKVEAEAEANVTIGRGRGQGFGLDASLVSRS